MSILIDTVYAVFEKSLCFLAVESRNIFLTFRSLNFCFSGAKDSLRGHAWLGTMEGSAEVS